MWKLWKRFWNYVQVKKAVRYAKQMHELTKKRYYVIKVYNKIRVYDRAHIDFLIREKVLSTKLRDSQQLQKICIYFTK